MQTKRLTCSIKELKLLPSTDTGLMEFSGYGAAFNNVDCYGDVIQPGAFSGFIDDMKSGKQNWPVMMLQHGAWGATAEDYMPVGIWTDLAEDDIGLKVTGRLAETDSGKDCYTLMKMVPRPAITGLSIGYIAQEYDQPVKPDAPKRLLKRIDLVEISIVTFPANDLSQITDVKNTPRNIKEFERFLRDEGYSQKEAKTIISQGFRAYKSDVDAEIKEATRKTIELLKRNISLIKPK